MLVLQAFPSLTEDEFSLACKAFEDRSFDNLNGTDWLSVQWTGQELLIKQKREIESQHSGDLEEDPGSDQNEQFLEDSSLGDTVRKL